MVRTCRNSVCFSWRFGQRHEIPLCGCLAGSTVHPPCDDPHLGSQGKYTAVKVLQRCYSLSDAERAKKLLSLPGLGDGTTLEVMESILSLLGMDDGRFLFTQEFLQHLVVQAGKPGTFPMKYLLVLITRQMSQCKGFFDTN